MAGKPWRWFDEFRWTGRDRAFKVAGYALLAWVAWIVVVSAWQAL